MQSKGEGHTDRVPSRVPPVHPLVSSVNNSRKSMDHDPIHEIDTIGTKEVIGVLDPGGVVR